MSQPERRAAARIASRLPVAIGDGHGELLTQTENVSTLGAYCTVKRFLAPMTKLQIRLEVPGHPQPTPVTCEGVVVRVDPVLTNPTEARYQVAILFRDLSDRSRSVLAHYVQQRLHTSVLRG